MGKRKTPVPFPRSGSLIRKYRNQHNYSIAQLAQLIDIDPKYLSNLETGHQMASIKVLYRLAVILNVSIENLLVEETTAEQNPQRRDIIIQDLDGMNDEELMLVHQFICQIVPFTRKFKEY